MNDRTTNPFALAQAAPSHSAGGALAQATTSRDVAETQAMFLMASMRPRDPVKAMDRILNACTRVTLAEKSTYEYSRGGSDVNGPSIRLAEAIAQQWGNFDFGFREITRGIDPDGVGWSEVMAYAIDMETVTRKPIFFRVRHWRDTKKGGYALKDERDIYELMANMASRRVRNCILSLIPGDVVEAAVNQCATTLKTSADTSPEAITRMVEAFASFGVTKSQIEKRIQRRLDSIQPGQIVQLRRIYTSIADDMSRPEDWFEPIAAGEEPQPKAKAPQAKPQATAAAAAANAETGEIDPPAPAAQPRIDPQDSPDVGAEPPAPAAKPADQAKPAAPAQSNADAKIVGLSDAQQRVLLSRAKSAGLDEAALLEAFGSIGLDNLNQVLAELKRMVDAQG